LQTFIERLREDDDYFLAAAEYAFDNALGALRKPELTAKQKADRATKAAAFAKLVGKIKAGIVLLKLRMPNGKVLAKCTGAECSHFGGWFSRVAAEVGPNNLVGDVLDEKAIRAIYRAA
jgi:hypothetical protein